MKNPVNSFMKAAGSHPTTTYILLALATYPILASWLRFRRLKSLQKKYNYPTRESMAKMTDNEAWEIQTTISQLEFPFFYVKSLQFALFKTYGIPSISRLLSQTNQFSNPRTSYKRYSDTRILVGEFIAWPPTSDRGQAAIARTKYLHEAYRKTGKISEDDMLYTLSLFAQEPILWIDQYEWRTLSELEKCALGTYWKSLGDALGISYAALPSSKDGFRDGLHWLEEIMAWGRAYEAERMVPDPTNREVAEQTASVLLYLVPKALRPVGMDAISYLMGDRLRKAMLYEPPPIYFSLIISTILSIRKLFLRYLALPRPYCFRYLVFSHEPDQYGRIFIHDWEAAPYYVKPTLWIRWGPFAWLNWLLGLPLPGDHGDEYYPQGYLIAELGPRAFEGKGKEQMKTMKEVLRRERTGGCPFR